MNKTIYRISSLIIALALTFGIFNPGRAKPRTAELLSGVTVNLAYFYKPPSNSDAATVANNFGTVILTGNDEAFRDQLAANGFGSTVLEYFGSIGIQDPGSCTATPRKNQVAYNAGDFCSISANHPDWFLLDPNGQRVPASPGSDTYRMDPGSPGWREFYLTRVLDYQARKGWSGLFLDNLEASLTDVQKYGLTLAKYPDDASYQAAIRGFLEYLRVNYSQAYNRPMLANIIARRDEAGWFNYMPYLDGAMQERWAVGWSISQYVSESQWKSDLELAEKTQNQGKHIILVAPGSETDANRQNFAFASYFLISNGKAAFRYSNDSSYSRVWLYNNYQVDLGTPLGPRYQSGTSWRRDFTKGYVIVDPVSHTATISTDSPSAPITSTPVATTQAAPSPTPLAPTATPLTIIAPTKTATPLILPSPTPTLVAPTASQTLLPVSPTATKTTSPATQTAAKTYDDKNSLFVYSSGWQTMSTSKAYGGSYKETIRNGATVTFPFTGKSFSIIYKGGVTFGKLDVYIDGVLVGTLNQKLSVATYQKRWDYPGQLTLGKHTLKLVFRATSTTTISRASLDAIIVR